MLKIIADDFVKVAIFTVDGSDEIREAQLNVVAKWRGAAFDRAATVTRRREGRLFHQQNIRFKIVLAHRRSFRSL